MNRTIFALNTKEAIRKEITLEEAKRYNEKGFGIFWSVNELDGKGYKKENVKKINSWYCDIDGFTGDIYTHMNKCPLFPSMIVKTKNGYHVYWNAVDGTIENYDKIETGIVRSITLADPKAKDLVRILRCPNYNHLKDETDPYLVHCILDLDIKYTEYQMMQAFKVPSNSKEEKSVTTVHMEYPSKMSLEILSGTKYVNGEKFTFACNSNGSEQILVDGKRTSSWIDSNDAIGSLCGGGPTIIQWLKYYNKGNGNVDEALKHIEREIQVEAF